MVVALYLLSNHHAGPLGIYYLPITLPAHETGLGEEQVRRALTALGKAQFAHYDNATETVYIPKMTRFQVLDGHERMQPADNRMKAIRRAYLEAHESPFLGDFFDRYGEIFELPARRGGPDDGPCKPLRTSSGGPSEPLPSPSEGVVGGSRHEHEHDHEQLQSHEHEGSARPGSPEGEAVKPLTVPGLQALWNRFAELSGWARWRDPAPARERVAQVRLRQTPAAAPWEKALEQASQSSFLVGRTRQEGRHANWRPTPDWLLKAGTLERILGGNYDDAPAAPARPPVRLPDGTEQA